MSEEERTWYTALHQRGRGWKTLCLYATKGYAEGRQYAIGGKAEGAQLASMLSVRRQMCDGSEDLRQEKEDYESDCYE